MTERPILMSAPMVCAILAGAKIQTRRVMKPQPPGQPLGVSMYHPERVDRRGEYVPGPERFGAWGEEWDRPCPYGAPGDLLWVREAWGLVGLGGTVSAQILRSCGPAFKPGLTYRADDDARKPLRWRPSIHMPRWASRITLRVTSVRVERVQDISEEDARAEGCVGFSDRVPSHRESFMDLWWSINGEASWQANPWVWVVGFERAEVAA